MVGDADERLLVDDRLAGRPLGKGGLHPIFGTTEGGDEDEPAHAMFLAGLRDRRMTRWQLIIAPDAKPLGPPRVHPGPPPRRAGHPSPPAAAANPPLLPQSLS